MDCWNSQTRKCKVIAGIALTCCVQLSSASSCWAVGDPCIRLAGNTVKTTVPDMEYPSGTFAGCSSLTATELNMALSNAHLLMSGNETSPSKLVAIVSVSPDGKLELNPPIKLSKVHFQYRDIPELKNMSESFCNSFFGNPQNKDSKVNTYKLYEKTENGKTEPWTLQFRFHEAVVSEFRISGPKFQSKEWIEVK